MQLVRIVAVIFYELYLFGNRKFLVLVEHIFKNLVLQIPFSMIVNNFFQMFKPFFIIICGATCGEVLLGGRPLAGQQVLVRGLQAGRVPSVCEQQPGVLGSAFQKLIVQKPRPGSIFV